MTTLLGPFVYSNQSTLNNFGRLLARASNIADASEWNDDRILQTKGIPSASAEKISDAVGAFDQFVIPHLGNEKFRRSRRLGKCSRRIPEGASHVLACPGDAGTRAKQINHNQHKLIVPRRAHNFVAGKTCMCRDGTSHSYRVLNSSVDETAAGTFRIARSSTHQSPAHHSSRCASLAPLAASPSSAAAPFLFDAVKFNALLLKRTAADASRGQFDTPAATHHLGQGELNQGT